MIRKKGESKLGTTNSLIKFREKRKWQIALRRYVLERNICFDYAPYFGLDIENMRRWLECQFKNGAGWGDFAKKWQFDHIVPVAYFDFSDDRELKMCWNFINISIQELPPDKDGKQRNDLLSARRYFEALYSATGYPVCQDLLHKIDDIEEAGHINTDGQQLFINNNRGYLDMIEHYTAFEFELINRGRDINEVKREAEFIRKFDSRQGEEDNFATDV